ncbi:cadherin-89D [Periplaneta americana]|uniref:cadherin-89D n=1 Tax=Periplaneta americana TaxID=6978 RepID=UPI0037E770DC
MTSHNVIRCCRHILVQFFATSMLFHLLEGCQFYPAGEYLRFVRVPENVPVGGEVLQIEVHPRRNLTLQPVDKVEDINYFTYQDVSSQVVSVILAQSLEDLVDSDSPQNVLKFRLVCDYNDGEDTISSYLSVTVYVEDVNDHAPQFINAPYHVTVDELTPTGLTIFRGIHAVDNDKPNTPNSDIQYSIVDGNDKGKFAMESSHRAVLVLRKALDYDAGDREFVLTLMASDRGSPPKNSTTTIEVLVLDNDDLSPKFSQDVYRTQVTEFYPLSGKKIHQELKFNPPILAYDQDLAIDAPVHYDIIAGNDRNLFAVDGRNGSLFLEQELDLDKERTLPGNTFVLQLQASQVDNPLKTGLARVEIELLDLNDNLPEFEVDLYNISIVENLPNGFSVLQVMASDKDQGDNGEFTYQLEDPSQAFIIDPRTGWLTVRDQSMLDREKQPSLGMRVHAKEKAPSVIKKEDNSSAEASVGVEVTLLDANDNNPSFTPSNLYEFTVENDAAVGDIIGQVKATDPDLGRNGMVLYDLQRPSNGSSNTSPLPFAVDAQNGQVMVIDSPLAVGRHALFIEASDQPANPSERRYSLAVVTIEVLKAGSKDKGVEVPDFIGAPYEFWVGGNVAVGTSVGQIRVTDAVDKSHVGYDLLHSYHDGVPFAVEERSGTITVVDEISKFEQPLYDFEAVVTDGQDLTLVTNVTIHVVDDERGIGTKGPPIEFRVRENLSGALVGQLLNQSRDQNSSDSSRWKSLRFIIANQQDVTDRFAVSQDGTIYTQRGLDREERDIYRLTLITENSRGMIRGAGVYQVNVIVEDENDNAPLFERSSYEGHVEENSPGGTEVQLDYLIHATDADIGHHAQFTFTLHGEGSEMFNIDQTTGRVYVKGLLLDREEKAVYLLRVVARDKGNLKSEVKLTIHIDDVNDNAPSFWQMVVLHDQDVEIGESSITRDRYTNTSLSHGDIHHYTESTTTTNFTDHRQLPPVVSILENTPIGTPVLRVLAGDKDAGNNATITYKITSESHNPVIKQISRPLTRNYFTIQPQGGEVTIARTLPPETDFYLNITATDGGGLADNITVRIHVKDVNDHAPVFKKSWYNFDLEEGFYSGKSIGRIEATDADYGSNAEIVYSILQNDQDDFSELPFRISEKEGILTVTGDIDREVRDSYTFQVTARDSGPPSNQQHSMVDVEIHILDVNDNAPSFYDYDRIIEIPSRHVEFDSDHFHYPQTTLTIPVYYASVLENSPPGTVVTKLFANDSDFPGNGNGLLLFDIPRPNQNGGELFAIDSKDGIVITIGKLDYEIQNTYNITVIASDLGNPSLSSTALLVVNVLDVPEDEEEVGHPMFAHRYYEVEIEENSIVPMVLLVLNVTDNYKGQSLRYSLLPSPGSEAFEIVPSNGTLYMVHSPDREVRARYNLKVRAEVAKRGRGLPVMLYPLAAGRLADLAPNEVRIIVRVRDVNDNAPRFIINGRPIVAAIPTTATYGYQIVRLQATDPDEGLNSDIRYQILGRADDESRKFIIDPITGQVRSIVSFAHDAGRVYGFDVKATDRRGADDGKSAITNVFVYVLDEEKQLVMVMGSKPTTVEKDMENITNALYNLTGLDVRVRKIEPHVERDLDEGSATDLYLYAVDPRMNIIIDMDTLQHVLNKKQSDIKRCLEHYRVLEIANGAPVVSKPRNQRYLLSSLEVGVVVLGCVVFVGALAAAICVGCVRRGKQRKQQKSKAYQSQVGFTISNPTNPIMSTSTKAHLFPASYLEGLPCGDTTDTYVDLHSSKSMVYGPHYHQRHDPSCSRHREHRRRSSSVGQQLRPVRSSSNVAAATTGLEASITSLQSSGQDSGIGRCVCGHSTSHSSGDSSNGSYEDSLKSLHRQHNMASGHIQHTSLMRRGTGMSSRRRQRHNSISGDVVQLAPDIQQQPSKHQHKPSVHIAAPTSALVRRASERSIVCPMPNE